MHFLKLISKYLFVTFFIICSPCFGQQKEVLKLVTSLSDEVKESSGLVWTDGLFWTHNDKGGPNILFAIDTVTGKVVKNMKVRNSKNNDWEDLAQSRTHIFVGDMGNNNGKRENLKILMIKKEDLKPKTSEHSVHAETINFYYPEQTSFIKTKDHNFDCEAIFYANNHIYLFTKNRMDLESSLYAIPAQAGTHPAKLVARFDTKGLITGADISPSGKKVVLIGYNKKSDAFIWILEKFKEDNYFSGTKRKVNLGKFKKTGQIEAVCFKAENELWISAESLDGEPAKLYKLHL